MCTILDCFIINDNRVYTFDSISPLSVHDTSNLLVETVLENCAFRSANNKGHVVRFGRFHKFYIFCVYMASDVHGDKADNTYVMIRTTIRILRASYISK